VVKTIENGLTVAKDSSGQFTTIGAALEKIQPHQTIRVLDAAVYAEEVRIGVRNRMEGITLEAPRGATLLAPVGAASGFLIGNVPRVTLRGFRVRTQGPRHLCLIAGVAPGATLENLDISADGGPAAGVSIEQLDLSEGDAPVTVRNCAFSGLLNAVRVSGSSNAGRPAPSRRIVVRDNQISDSTVGIWVSGLVSDLHIVGNRVWNCHPAAFQIEALFNGSADLLIANNSLQGKRACIQIAEVAQPVERVSFVNNLILAERMPDVEFLGTDRTHVTACQWQNNWRAVPSVPGKSGEDKTWIPPAKNDVVKDRIDVLSRDPADSNFLRPAKNSPLATGGAGGDLPVYVGAVPPEGVEPWDWDKTWNARARTGKEPNR
jgi:hypothetical protein